MRVGVYFSPWAALRQPTGVGVHALGMSRALCGMSEAETRLLGTRREWDAAGRIRGLEGLEDRRVLLPAWCGRRALLLGLGCRIDAGRHGLDWVLAPKEQPVAVRGARQAVTLHDVLPLEDPSSLGLPSPSRRRDLRRWRRVLRATVRRADLLLVVSEFSRRRLHALWPDARRIPTAVIGNGVAAEYLEDPPPDDHDVLADLGVAPQRYLIAVGGLNHRKGGDLLVDAAVRLETGGESLPLLVCGQRHDASLLARLAHEQANQRAREVRLVGFLEPRRLAALVRHATALVMPSRYEGFGIPVLEALAVGTPVIASNRGALPEVLLDDGLLLEDLRPDALLEAVAAVRADPRATRERTERGQARARAETWERCASRVLEALRAA